MADLLFGADWWSVLGLGLAAYLTTKTWGDLQNKYRSKDETIDALQEILEELEDKPEREVG